MRVEKIMNDIMEKSGKSKAELGRAVGIEKTKASDIISKRLKQKNISVNVLCEMLSAMGYEMRIVPTGAVEKKVGYEVTINE